MYEVKNMFCFFITLDKIIQVGVRDWCQIALDDEHGDWKVFDYLVDMAVWIGES